MRVSSLVVLVSVDMGLGQLEDSVFRGLMVVGLDVMVLVLVCD